MSSLPSAIMNSGGGTKKPFSYCPGGIDFSELKSPKIARRIAKHQAGMNEPSSTLPPPQKTSKNVSNTKTLPNVKPVMGRQRSISDLLTSDVDTAVSAPLPSPPVSQATPYNPYSGDRSLSIPPPTPPPVRQSQAASSQEPVNRAISLPPGASSPAPARHDLAKTQPGPGTGVRPGLPPPHPLHAIIMASKQQEVEQNGRQDSVPRSQEQPQMAPSRAPPPAPSGLAPPPPPPPPPPGSLGVVARHGPSGVPIATKRPVKVNLTLAEIRAGNTNYGPPSPQAVSEPEPVIPPPQNFSTDTRSTGQPEKQTIDFIAPTTQRTHNLNENNYNEITDADFMKTLNEFEAQRNAMMNPQAVMSVNSDIIKHQMPLREITSPVRVEETFANENIYHEPYAPPVSMKDVPQLVNSTDQFSRDTESKVLADIKVNATAPSQDQTTLTSLSKDIKMNDDINMLRHKDNHSPRPQSLQKNCQEHSVTPKAFKEDSKIGLVNQKSLDNDDAELTAIADSNKSDHTPRERRNSHNIVRYRPETPRTVTPVRFTPIPRLPNKGFKSPEPEKVKSPVLKSPTPSLKSPEPETGFKFPPSSMSQVVKNPTVMSPPPSTPLSPLKKEPSQPLESNPRPDQVSFKNPEVVPPSPVVRNVSDSGISVDSNNSDVDDTAGKIVAESMLKIEAQMKRILEHENKNKASRESNRNSSNLSSPLPDENTNGSKLQTPPRFFPDRKDSVKTGSFEIMEDFEEAPEEFDLGISSYSIAHPIDNISNGNNDEADKSKNVPDIVEADDYSRLPLEDTPYVVSTPSGTLNRDTLDNQSGNHRGAQHPQHTAQHPPPVNNVNSANTNYGSVPNPAYQQQQHFPSDMSSATSRLGEMPSFFDPFGNNAFGMMGMGMTGIPAPLMDNQFPSFPSMFDNQFQQQQMNIMNQNLDSIGLKQQQHQNPRQHQHQQQQKHQQQQQQQQRSEERIIPIQVIKSQDTPDRSQQIEHRQSPVPSSPLQKTPPPPPPPKVSTPSPAPGSAGFREKIPSQNDQRIPITPAPVLDKMMAPVSVGQVNGRNSPAKFMSGKLSPTPAMLQNQIESLKPKKEEESINIPVRNQINPSYDRRNSYTAAENIRSRMMPKTKTPTFGELQFRYGKDYKSPSPAPAPVLDKDYQKNARQTVVGELSSFGGNFQASKISGRRKPSQSPSMRLLGMLHVQDDSDGPVTELQGTSQEYTGDRGRFMPPPAGAQPGKQGGVYQRSLSSQL